LSRTPILNRRAIGWHPYNPDAYFHRELGEFILPYDKARVAADPDQLILDFYRGTYEVGATLAAWDRAGLERPDWTPAAVRTVPTTSKMRG
jgi:hypothetical protein